MDGLYHGCCAHHQVSLSADETPEDYQAYIDTLIKQLYAAQSNPETDPVLIRAYGQKLEQAVTEGFGTPLNKLDWDSPDYNTLTALQNNVWQFSAAKTYTQLQDMNAALIGPDGKIRGFNEFKQAAQEIAGEQLNWLRTEYSTAIASGQMAGKWQTIQEQKGTLPLLEFDAVIDDRTSTICRPLNKVVRPVDDAFWDLYYPPNHFNCRSTVRQLRDGTVTPADEISYPEKVPDMFKVNLGKKSLAFPPDHPYYQGTPAHIIGNATLYMPEAEQSIIKYESEDGTQLLANRQIDIKGGSDYADLLKVGEVLANGGIPATILPEIHVNEDGLRNELLPGVKDGKNPDLEINGEYYEMKKPSDPVTYSNLQKLIAKASQQADRVIILLDQKYKQDDMKNAAANRFVAIPSLQEIGFVTSDGEYIEYKRGEM